MADSYDPSQIVSASIDHSESHNHNHPATIHHCDESHNHDVPTDRHWKQQFFHRATNVQLKNSQFHSIRTTVNVDHDTLMTHLYPHIARAAIFDSAAREDLARCHPGTRKQIIGKIQDWAQERGPTSRILWLHGPAGAGKSAIAQAVCDRLNATSPEALGGSFFFRENDQECGSAGRLFATLAFQLADRFPSICEKLNPILRKKRGLGNKTIVTQLKELIIEPLSTLRDSFAHNPVLIIDGLDECEHRSKGQSTQRKVLSMIAKAIVDDQLPLKCMIASRPEAWIQKEFGTDLLYENTRVIDLFDDEEVNTDIENTFTDGFQAILAEHTSIERSWPGPGIILQLVWNACGQFIYVDTVLRFVGSTPHGLPKTQLRMIMDKNLHPGDMDAAYSRLDHLYMTILRQCPSYLKDDLKLVLEGILLGANTAVLKVVLNINPEVVKSVLETLSSVIQIKKFKPSSPGSRTEAVKFVFENLEEDDAIIICHKSFQDFLHNKDRSGIFYIDMESSPVPKIILDKVFDMINRNIDNMYEEEPHIFWKINFVTYNYMIKVLPSIAFTFTGSACGDLVTKLIRKLKEVQPHITWTHMHSLFRLTAEIENLLGGLLQNTLIEHEPDMDNNNSGEEAKSNNDHSEKEAKSDDDHSEEEAKSDDDHSEEDEKSDDDHSEDDAKSDDDLSEEEAKSDNDNDHSEEKADNSVASDVPWERLMSVAINVLEEICIGAQRAMPSYKDFKVTPAFVYLAEYSTSALPVGLDELSTIASVSKSDIIPSLRQYRDVTGTSPMSTHLCNKYGCLGPGLLHLCNKYDCPSPGLLNGWTRDWKPDQKPVFSDENVGHAYEMTDIDGGPQLIWPISWPRGHYHILFQNRGDIDLPKWRIESKWRNLRISFADKSLEIILERWPLDMEEKYESIDDQLITLARFFWSSISDISSEEYFQNTSNQSILVRMADKQKWARTSEKKPPEYTFFFISVLCWFNRQLTDTTVQRLLSEYDNSLKERMSETMIAILRQMLYIEPTLNHTGHWVQAVVYPDEPSVNGINAPPNAQTVRIVMQPLPKGFCIKPEVRPHVHYAPDLDFDDWHPFSVELSKTLNDPVIYPQAIVWYSMMLRPMLKELVECLLYRCPKEKESILSQKEITIISISLAYAVTDEETLDAFRGIVYFYPRTTPLWNPPRRFLVAMKNTLERYERSILSSEEYDHFMSWLNNRAMNITSDLFDYTPRLLPPST